MSQTAMPESWLRSRDRLIAQIRESLASKSSVPPVNFSTPKHTASVLALQTLVYDGSNQLRQLPIIFSDGSRAALFPLLGWSSPPAEMNNGPRPLRLGLMSFRHPELDYIVDLYACRNRELAALQSMAEEEEYAYRRALEILTDPSLKGGAIIEVYHTGLEPMVVGFYRGVVTAQSQRAQQKLPRSLAIYPKLFNAKGTRESLTPNSPGARVENYITAPLWW